MDSHVTEYTQMLTWSMWTSWYTIMVMDVGARIP